MNNLVIIWSWWAWFTAWIYAWRYWLNPIILWSNDGWMIIENPIVENFPWFNIPTSGYEIMQKIKNQALKYGAEYKIDTIKEINPINKNNFKKWYNIKTTFNWTIQSKSIILAIWTKKNILNIKWEKKFFWKWVSYCATCDWFFYKWKITAVLWWWDSAFIEALYLANICKKVYLIHRRDTFKAEPIRIEKAKKHANIEFVLNYKISEIYWNDTLEWINVSKNWKIKNIKLNWLFIAIGMTPNKINWLDEYLKRDDKNYIKVDSSAKTNLHWVFAIWDCSDWNNWFRQLVVACAEWAVSAENVFKYISKNN